MLNYRHHFVQPRREFELLIFLSFGNLLSLNILLFHLLNMASRFSNSAPTPPKSFVVSRKKVMKPISLGEVFVTC